MPTMPDLVAERRQVLLVQLVAAMQAAQRKHDSIQDQATYLLERFEISARVRPP